VCCGRGGYFGPQIGRRVGQPAFHGSLNCGQLDFTDQFLDRSDRGWGDREAGYPDAEQCERFQPATAHFAAYRYICARWCHSEHNAAQEAQDGGREPVIPFSKLRIRAIGGKKELGKVVGPDRQERQARCKHIETFRERRNFKHRTIANRIRQQLLLLLQKRELTLEDGACGIELPRLGHHREHHVEGASASRLKQRPRLHLEQAIPLKRDAQRAPAHCGVLFGLAVIVTKIGKDLVTSDIDGAEHDGPITSRIENIAIEARLALARAQLQQAQAQLISSRENYIQIVGTPPVGLEEPPALPNLPNSPATAVSVALDNNPNLIAARRQADATRYDINVARANRLPRISAVAGPTYFNYLGSLPNASVAPNSGTAASAGLQLNLPLFQGGRPAAQVRQAEAQRGQALETVTATERAVIAQARSAYAVWQSSQQVIASSETAVNANKLSLEGVRAENSVGTRTVLEILNAEQELLNSQVTLVSARRDAYVAGFALLAAMGHAEARDLGLEGGDLRAAERTFQQIRQVSGRAGRGAKPGHVFIQTHSPSAQVMQALITGDAEAFYEAETEARRDAGAPPFGRYAAIVVSSEEQACAHEVARAVAQSAPRVDGMAVYGPAPAPLAMLRGRHRYRLLVHARRALDVQDVIRDWLGGLDWPAKARVTVDVDPYNFL